MSATPIPRTLYLALTERPRHERHRHAPGQPPPDPDDREDLRREGRRRRRSATRCAAGGQVFYLHNRVGDDRPRGATRLRELMPDLAFGVGHGQMHADDLERVMTDFVAGKYNVLVCTTIIESGLDIPNCNTLIIEGADRFGLSQLYQLRGRVGPLQAPGLRLPPAPPPHPAPRHRPPADEHPSPAHPARGRVSGSRCATSSCGAPATCSGPSRAGTSSGVGFELYCQLLRQSVARLKGDKTAAAIRASVKLDFVFVGEGGPAEDSPARAAARTATRRSRTPRTRPAAPRSARDPGPHPARPTSARPACGSTSTAGWRWPTRVAAVRQIEAELKDRFGKLGPEVRTLLQVTEIRVLAEQKGIISVETESNRLKCLRGSGQRDDWVMIGARFPRLTAPTPASTVEGDYRLFEPSAESMTLHRSRRVAALAAFPARGTPALGADRPRSDDNLNLRFANGIVAIAEDKVITVDDVRREIDAPHPAAPARGAQRAGIQPEARGAAGQRHPEPDRPGADHQGLPEGRQEARPRELRRQPDRRRADRPVRQRPLEVPRLPARQGHDDARLPQGGGGGHHLQLHDCTSSTSRRASSARSGSSSTTRRTRTSSTRTTASTCA